MDLEPGTIDSVCLGQFGQLVRPNNFVFDNLGAGINCVKDHFTNDSVLDLFRDEVGSLVCMKSFLRAHSMEGGTGAGIETLPFPTLWGDYLDHAILTSSVILSPTIADTIFELTHDTILIHILIDNVNTCFARDVEILHNNCFRTIKLFTSSYGHLSQLMVTKFVGSTTTVRGIWNRVAAKFAVMFR